MTAGPYLKLRALSKFVMQLFDGPPDCPNYRDIPKRVNHYIPIPYFYGSVPSPQPLTSNVASWRIVKSVALFGFSFLVNEVSSKVTLLS